MNLLYEPYISTEVLEPIHQGKVRETYLSTVPDCLVQVATNRISTHEQVHESPIPFKGEVLTMLTVFWLTNALKSLPNHLVAWGRSVYNYLPPGLEEKYPDLHYRALVVHKLDMVPREFIPRGFLTGSLLKYYLKGEDPYGVNLPPGLVQMSRFDKPVFTCTEKSATDDPLNAAEALAQYPEEVSLVMCAFELAKAYLATLGITVIDSKLEIGSLSLADEIVTPDSSRFAWTKDIKEGSVPSWLDKQLVRDYVESVWGDGPKRPLVLPEEIIDRTSAVYTQLLYEIANLTLIEWRNKFDRNV